MNRTFFVKTEQSSCETLAPAVEAVDEAVDEEAKKTEDEAEATRNETEFNKVLVDDTPEIIPTTVRD